MCFIKNTRKILDAGITKWNLRPRKIKDKSKLCTIQVEDTGLQLKDFKTSKEQSKYKYILNIDGHVSSFRLSNELGYKSVILKVDSKWKLWFSDLLKPGVHYIPIKNDLSNLITTIEWCINNDDKCKQIASNAREFYDKYLSNEGVLNTLQKKCNEIAYIQKSNNLNLDSDIYNLNNMVNKQINILTNIHSIKDTSNFIISKIDKEDLEGNTFHRFKKINSLRIFPFLESINEFFVSSVKLNRLANKIPNFNKNISYEEKDGQYYIKQNVVEGITFYDFMLSDNLNIHDFISIVVQICLSIDMCKYKCNVIHNDLTPWNIIIKKLDKETEIIYKLSNQNTFKYRTNILAVIIDYGKSSIVYKNSCYGLYNRYIINAFQDIIVFIVTTLKCLLKKHQSKDIFNLMMHMITFFNGSNFISNNITSCRDLKIFVEEKSKFSDLLLQHDKRDFYNVTPLNFLRYLHKRYNTIPCIISTNIISKVDLQTYRIFKAFIDKYIDKKYHDEFNTYKIDNLIQIMLR